LITILAVIIVGYLLGSIPTGVWVGKWARGIDIRLEGSKSIGATNVFRLLGARLAIPVLLIDISKGFFACLIASKINLGDTLLNPGQLAMIAGLAAIFGHLFPLFAGFKGGKGVATGAGMLLFLMPMELGFGLIIFVVSLLITRFVSLSSILATACIFISTALEKYAFHYAVGNEIFILCCIILILILYTHRANIRRLIDGTENRLGVKK
jgi:glycerol-3-phosphate acyltransferase PlsY